MDKELTLEKFSENPLIKNYEMNFFRFYKYNRFINGIIRGQQNSCVYNVKFQSYYMKNLSYNNPISDLMPKALVFS